MTAPKVIIIGLDSMPPQLAFDTYRDVMPCLNDLCRHGLYGPLRSTDPPITIPAWIAMTTGRPPQDLGIYGFRRPTKNSYQMALVNRADIRFPQIWDYCAAANLSSVVVSVPLTYPAIPDPYITMTTGFLTPSTDGNWASSALLKTELTQKFGPYRIDVDDFRSGQTDRIVAECFDLTTQHFNIFRHLIATRHPRFAMMVDLGPDRLHHACLRHIMPSHPHYEPSDLGRNYYACLDKEIEQTVALGDSNTLIMIVSDHGVKPLLGGFAVNDRLVQSGHLVLDQSHPNTPTPLSGLQVDWSKTIAWGEGGYHARIFINRTDRYPKGIVSPSEVDTYTAELKHLFQHHTYPNGKTMKTIISTAKELYPHGTGHPPDMTVYWDNLNLRSVGTVGNPAIITDTNDTGPDDANHDYNGILAMTTLGTSLSTPGNSFSIYDVFATAMHHLELIPQPQTLGEVLSP